MSFFEYYLSLNFIFTLAAVFSLAISVMIKFVFPLFSSVQLVKIHYSFIFAAFFVFCVLFFVPEESFQIPISQNFTSQVIQQKTTLSSSFYKIETPKLFKERRNISLTSMMIFFILVMFLIEFLRFSSSLLKNFSLIRNAHLLKKYGKLTIFVSEKTNVPYVFSFMGKSFVNIPIFLLENRRELTCALKHEIQHIRRLDTSFAYLLCLLKSVFCINPIIRIWIESISLEQEFACDESLIEEGRVNIHDYQNCLLNVTQMGNHQNHYLFYTLRMFSFRSQFLFGSELTRRFKMMGKKYKKIQSRSLGMFLVIAVGVLFISSYTFHVHAALGKLGLKELRSLVKKSDFSKEFPIEVNKEVVNQVNRLARTKKGARYSKKALSNYFRHKQMIEKYLFDYGYPKELAAIAFIESQYMNLPQAKKGPKGAGMWQFIPSTARAYNLKVEKWTDERMDIHKETDAAMRYLGALHLRFQDWKLAMLSYNAGEGAVQEKITKMGSRDAWKISKSNLKYDKGYLEKVIAAAIIIKYPEIVR